MECKLTPEATIMLDKILQCGNSDVITVDTLSDFTIQLCSSDLSQYSVIRIEPSFFLMFNGLNKSVSFPYQKLYRPGMKVLEISQSCDGVTKLHYKFKNVDYYKNISNVRGELFDLDFATIWTLRIDLNCVKAVIKKASEDFVLVDIDKRFNIIFQGTVASIPINEVNFTVKFRVDRKSLLSIINNSKSFTDHVLAFSSYDSPLNIIFRNSEIHVSTFLSIEWL